MNLFNQGISEKYSNDEYTPDEIHVPIGPFYFDPCAGINTRIGTHTNWKKEDNGLFAMEWPKGEIGYVNPPFTDPERGKGRMDDAEWKKAIIKKCHEHGNNILLLPPMGSASWYKYLFERADGMMIMHCRTKFLNPNGNRKGQAKFTTTLFTFGPLAESRLKNSGLDGTYFKRP